jgi:hypothetical protein
LERTPSAQGGYNTGTIAICLNGLDESDFTEEQYDALQWLCGEINRAYGGIRFRGHNEVAAKACPVFDYRFVLGLNENGYMTQVAEIPPVEPLPTHQMMITRATVSSIENREHPDVRIAQALLVAAGENPGAVDGIGGPKFAKAVKGFQQVQGLTADGIVGPQTWEQLEDAGL